MPPPCPTSPGSLTPAFEQDPTISALAAGTVTQAELGLQRVDVLGLQQDQGAVVAPTVLEGRLPKRPNEMMLGTTTLERAGVDIGDIAVLRLGNTATGLRVVGRGGLPGVRRHRAARQRRVPHVRRVCRRCCPKRNRTCSSCGSRTGSTSRRTCGISGARSIPYPTRSTGRPRELQELRDVTGLPTVLGALLAFLAAATLVHTLVELGPPATPRARGARGVGLRAAPGVVHADVGDDDAGVAGIADRPAARRAARALHLERVRHRSRRGGRTADRVDTTAPDHPDRAPRRQPDRHHSRRGSRRARVPRWRCERSKRRPG